MKALLCQIMQQFALSVGEDDLERRAWYVITAKGGPNAVLKIVIPSTQARGYVLTIARHAGTPVIRHEVAVLKRLKRSLPPRLCETIPTVLDHGEWDGVAYFGTPYYESRGHHRLVRRLARAKRARWVERWLTELALGTLEYGLTREMLETEHAETVARICADPRIADGVKSQVRASLESVRLAADRMPSVCCHGDIWAGNILWRRASNGAVILDWGAARWPGLPCVDLCRFLLANNRSDERVAAAVRRYCQAIDLDPGYVAPLFDLYNVFIKAELDLAYAMQPADKFDPFLSGLPSQRLSRLPPA